MRRTSPLAAVLVAATLALTGCGGSAKGEAKKKDRTPAQVMASAKRKFDDASSIHIKLKTDTVPSAGNAVLSATGDVTHAPAFKGQVKVLLSGLTATVPITATAGKVYAKLPFGTSYQVIRPSQYGAPDPSKFADPDSGLSSLLTKLSKLKKKGQTRKGDLILTTYTGDLAGDTVKGIIPSASSGATYATTVGLDEKGYAVAVKITGPFFDNGKDVTYDVAFDDYGKGVKISAPQG